MSQHHTQGRQGQGSRRRYHNKGGRAYGNGRRDGNSHRTKNKKEVQEKPSLWQRILSLFGIRPSKPKSTPAPKSAGKTNTRVVRNKKEFDKTPKQPVSTRRLYVGNLSYEASESDLEDVFKGIGPVSSVEIIYNPRTHKSKGYAFVEMRNLDDAVRSVEVLHNQPFMGRNLLVSGANERQAHAPARETATKKEEEVQMPEGEILKETSTPLFQNPAE